MQRLNIIIMLKINLFSYIFMMFYMCCLTIKPILSSSFSMKYSYFLNKIITFPSASKRKATMKAPQKAKRRRADASGRVPLPIRPQLPLLLLLPHSSPPLCPCASQVQSMAAIGQVQMVRRCNSNSENSNSHNGWRGQTAINKGQRLPPGHA